MQPYSKRLLFASWHNYLDPSNGASISTRDMLLALARNGWQVASLCGPGTDFPEPPDFSRLLESRGVKLDRTVSNIGLAPFSLLQFRDRGIVSTIHLPKKHQPIPDLETGNAFLQTMYDTLRVLKPNVFVTYGGFWMSRLILELVKKQGIKTVVLLHNLAYSKNDLFDYADLVTVPSMYAANHYRSILGMEPVVIPPMIDPGVVYCRPDETDRQYVVFVNPEPAKGVSVFMKIAKTLSVTRPDIRFLIVEARHKAVHLKQTDENLRDMKNLHVMSNTSSPKNFYSVAKIVLQPSLCNETFGRVAAESMINGIPVIGSNRGALPEVIGDAGLTLEIPARYTSDSRIAPASGEVEPWVQAVIQLWDDAEFYETLRQKSLTRAEQWRPDRIAGQYDECLSALIG